MQKHFSSEHDGVDEDFKQCKVQTLYNGPQVKYYGVIDANTSPLNDHDACIDRVVDFQANMNAPTPPSDERLLSAFARQFRWHEILKAHCSSELEIIVNAFRFDTTNATVKSIFPVICSYWRIGQELIGTQEYLLEQIMSSKESETDKSSSSFSRLQKSGEKYCKVLMSVLLMVKWQADSSDAIPDIAYTNDLCLRLDALVHFTSNCDESMSTFGEMAERVCDVEKLSGLHSVLEALYHFDLNDTHAPNPFLVFPTHRFLVLSAIKGFEKDSDGYVQICEPVDITSRVAVLKYWARQTSLMALHQRNWGVEPSCENEITATRAKQLQHFLRDGERTPFGTLQEVMRFGSAIAMAPEQKGMPQLAWLSSNFDRASLRGVIVSISDLKVMIRGLMNQLRSRIHAKVLRGFDLSFLQQILRGSTTVYDDYQNTFSGYSFLDDPQNEFANRRMDLATYLLRAFPRDFIGSASENNVYLNMTYVRQWCKDVDDVTKLWLPLVHISSGQPSRGSELSAMLFRNTGSGVRSVYLHGKRIMLVQRYHKGTSSSGQHRMIARFLPADLTLDFVAYLLYVRPALEFFMNFFPTGEQSSSLSRQSQHCHYYLWAAHQLGKFEGEAINSIINNAFRRSNLELSVSSYRHFAIGLKDKHLTPETRNNDMYDLQAAHSTKVASTLYSRSTTDPSFMSRNDMFEFFRCSSEWQTLLGLDNSRKSGASAVVVRTQVPSPCQTIGTQTLASDEQRLMQLRGTSHAELSEICPSTNFSMDVPVPVMIPPFRHPTLEQAQSTLSPSQFCMAQTHLKRFFGDDTASFKTNEQCIAASLIFQGVSNLLVVLPTNGGKSLLYQLPAFTNPRRTTVVVIPLVALLLESVQKSKAQGLHCTTYDPSMNPHGEVFALLFVGVDYISHPRFKQYVNTLYQREVLKNIFFDEAHLVITSRSYRSCMQSVKILASLDVQKILLTATLPPSWEPDLVAGFGFPFATLRLPTVRSEISYRIDEVQGVAQMLQACIDLVKLPLAHPSKGIIFVMTRREVGQLATILKSETGEDVAQYHSDLSLEVRREQLSKWKSNRVKFVVATSGLGQGVDYRHVRIIIHFGLTHSIVDYAQETGRAGRDGDPARCIAIYSTAYSTTVFKTIGDSGQNQMSGENITSRDVTEVDAFFRSKEHCRRQVLQKSLDGIGYPCTVHGMNRLCDICSHRSREIAKKMLDFDDPSGESQRILQRSQSGVSSQVFYARTNQLDEATIYDSLKQFLLDTRTFCRVCWVVNHACSEEHGSAQCPYQGPFCFKCLGEHRAKGCKNALIFRDGTCFVCGLPLVDPSNKDSLHGGSGSGKACSTKARGVMIPSVWRFFRNVKQNTSFRTGLEAQLCSFSERDFATWLVHTSPSGTMSNLCRLWAYILTSYE